MTNSKPPVQSYKDLEVWQKSMDMVTAVYQVTKEFPKDELYTLTNQIRRSAISVPSNIAEGRGKRSTGDYIRFLNIAYGSISELETQLIISKNLGYVSSGKLDSLFTDINRIGRMLNGLISSLEGKQTTSRRIPNPESRIPVNDDA
ncbi:MAG: four helix bundle protein [Alphaproteobacteria bacterium]|nr:four helix bundle protein [Alphaproteobacteria bacterium]